jgi:hypothetical protein
MQTTLSRLRSWAFDNRKEDIRGWSVIAPDGHSLGTVDEVVVDTVTRHVTEVITADGQKLRAHDLIVGDHTLTMATQPIPTRTPEEMIYYNDHFKHTYFERGYRFEAVAPAYTYGEELRRTMGDRDWKTVEIEGRRRWEERNPGTWDRFVDAIRQGWERVRS